MCGCQYEKKRCFKGRSFIGDTTPFTKSPVSLKLDEDEEKSATHLISWMIGFQIYFYFCSWMTRLDPGKITKLWLPSLCTILLKIKAPDVYHCKSAFPYSILKTRERKLSKNRIPSVLARFVRELQRFRKMTSFQIEQELAQNYFFLLVVIFKWI